MFVLTIAFVLEIQEKFQNENIVCVERNGYGEGTRKESVYMQIEDKEKELVEIMISPRSYSEQEIQQLFSNAMEELDQKVLGENPNAELITKNLCFIRSLPKFPFTISWRLSRYDIINMNGELQEECIRMEDPERKGLQLVATAFLRYEDREVVYEKDFLIFPNKSVEVPIREKVLHIIGERNSQMREASFVRLPDRVDNQKITWSRNNHSKSGVLILLGGVISVLVIVVEKQKKEKILQERRKQMLFDYPEIVSQMIILMSSGMTVKKVWKKIVDDYQKQKERTGRVRWAYEEMLYTAQEMQSGVSELQCYEHFAKRCDLLPYMKLGALLTQNLRKGTKGIWGQLEIESFEALEERKNQIKRLGEEAGTKLLLPMLLMLVIVLAIVIVPAFLSIRI